MKILGELPRKGLIKSKMEGGNIAEGEPWHSGPAPRDTILVQRISKKSLKSRGFAKAQEYLKTNTGWWFGTFFIFPYIWNNHPN